MMVLLRIIGLVVLAGFIAFGLWIMFVNLTSRENSMWFGGRPSALGVKDGKLADPRKTPNSVVSEGVPSTHPAYVASIPFTGDAKAALAKLGAVLQAQDRVTVIKVEDANLYVYAEFRSKTLGYIDDFEARIDPAASVIHVRSASRLGYSDKGFNRARVEKIREKFAASQ